MAQKTQKLQSQISEIDSLLKMDRKDPHFNAWVSKTERVLGSIFGEESIQVKSYKRISYTCGVYYYGMPDSDKINAHIRGLNEAKLLLEGMLDEIDEETEKTISYDFWPLIDEKIVAVSKKLFDDGHYASSVFEATKLVNNEIKAIVRNQINEEFDGTDLMNRAFSLSSPIIQLGDLTNETGKNIQRGYMEIYRGTISAIRNPKGHDNVQINQKKAIHFLFLANLLLLKISDTVN